MLAVPTSTDPGLTNPGSQQVPVLLEVNRVTVWGNRPMSPLHLYKSKDHYNYFPYLPFGGSRSDCLYPGSLVR